MMSLIRILRRIQMRQQSQGRSTRPSTQASQTPSTPRVRRSLSSIGLMTVRKVHPRATAAMPSAQPCCVSEKCCPPAFGASTVLPKRIASLSFTWVLPVLR